MKKNTILPIMGLAMIFLIANSSLNTASTTDSVEEESILKVAGIGIETISGLDPMTDGVGFPALQILDQTSETLFELGYDENGKTIAVPGLATNFTRPDAKTWRLTLEKNVTFHDGTEFNATSVEFHIQRLNTITFLYGTPWGLNPNLGAVLLGAAGMYIGKETESFDYSWMNPAGYYPYYNSTNIINATTIDLITNFPYDVDVNLCWYPHKIVSPTSLNWNTSALVSGKVVVGTGAYKVGEDDIDQLEGTATLTAYADYWGGAPDYDRIEIIYFDDDVSVTSALLNHEVDLASPQSPDEIMDVPNLILHVGQVSGYQQTFCFNLNNVPNVAIRKALSSAFDYQSYIDNLYSGNGVKGGGAISYTSSMYDPSIPIAQFDIAGARQLLIADGLVPSDAVNWTDEAWAIKAQNDPVTILDVPYSVFVDDAALNLQQAGRMIGININLTLWNAGDLDSAFWVPSIRATWDMFFTGYTMEFPTEYFYFFVYSHSWGFFNLAGVSNATLDSLILDIFNEEDSTEKVALIHEAAELVQNDIVPSIYIAQTRRYFAYWNGTYGVEEAESNFTAMKYRRLSNIDPDYVEPEGRGIPGFPVLVVFTLSILSVAGLIKKKRT